MDSGRIERSRDVQPRKKTLLQASSVLRFQTVTVMTVVTGPSRRFRMTAGAVPARCRVGSCAYYCWERDLEQI